MQELVAIDIWYVASLEFLMAEILVSTPNEPVG